MYTFTGQVLWLLFIYVEISVCVNAMQHNVDWTFFRLRIAEWDFILEICLEEETLNINAFKIWKLTFQFLCVVSGVRRKGTAVLNIFKDHDYNRSVITIVAAVDTIGKCALTTFVLSLQWYYQAPSGTGGFNLSFPALQSYKREWNWLIVMDLKSGQTFFWQRSERDLFYISVWKPTSEYNVSCELWRG